MGLNPTFHAPGTSPVGGENSDWSMGDHITVIVTLEEAPGVEFHFNKQMLRGVRVLDSMGTNYRFVLNGESNHGTVSEGLRRPERIKAEDRVRRAREELWEAEGALRTVIG